VRRCVDLIHFAAILVLDGIGLLEETIVISSPAMCVQVKHNALGMAHAGSDASAPLELAEVISKQEVQMLPMLHVMLGVGASRFLGIAVVQVSEAARFAVLSRTTPNA